MSNFAKYWAGSATQSIINDYAAGRVVTIQAPSVVEEKTTAEALGQSLDHWLALRDRDAAIEERYPSGCFDSDCYPDMED